MSKWKLVPAEPTEKMVASEDAELVESVAKAWARSEYDHLGDGTWDALGFGEKANLISNASAILVHLEARS